MRRARLALASYIAATSNATYEKRKKRFSYAQARRIVDYIHANLDRGLNLVEPAGVVGLRPRQFLKLFTQTFGRTPHQYVIYQRVAQARELLLGERPLAEIASSVGFANQSHFSNIFQKISGMSPGSFRCSFRPRDLGIVAHETAN